MILYIENPKETIIKLLELISKFSKVVDTRSIHRNLLHFYTLTMNDQKEMGGRFGGEWLHVYVWLSPLLFT